MNNLFYYNAFVLLRNLFCSIMEFYKVKELPASQGNCAKSYPTPLSSQLRSSCSFMFSDPQQMDCCGMKNFKFKITVIS